MILFEKKFAFYALEGKISNNFTLKRFFGTFFKNRKAISMRTLEMYMTMFFLLFMFVFFMAVVAQVRMGTIKNKASLSTHEVAFEIAERVASTEYLVFSEQGGQKKTSVFDPIKLSTASYDKLKEYLQEQSIDWEIEIYDLEGATDTEKTYANEVLLCYNTFETNMFDAEKKYAQLESDNERTYEAAPLSDFSAKETYEKNLKTIIRDRISEIATFEQALITCKKEAREKYDCSPDIIDWQLGKSGSPTCHNTGDGRKCAFSYAAPPSNNVDCMKCGYWRIGPTYEDKSGARKNLDLDALVRPKDMEGNAASDDNLQKMIKARSRIRRRIIYEFPAAISYYCDGRSLTERKKPIRLAVLRVGVIEWDWDYR